MRAAFVHLTLAFATLSPCLILGGCFATSSSSSSPADSGTRDAAPLSDAGPSLDSGAVADSSSVFTLRPYVINPPPGYDPSTPTPLVVMLHGFGTDGPGEETYLQLTAASNAHGFLYAYPDGSYSEVGPSRYRGLRFWNATNACCDFSDPPDAMPDDVAYLNAVIDDIVKNYNVDKKRIFLIGHSNGGFMAHRMACDAADRIAAIVSFEGAQWLDPTRCQPTARVSVVELHGDNDLAYDPATMMYGIPYDGGSTPEGTFPSAPATVQTWADKNGCAGALAATTQTYDLVPNLPPPPLAPDASPSDGSPGDAASLDAGSTLDAPPESGVSPDETKVEKYACKGSIDTELWTIKGGTHMPRLNPATFGEAVWAFFSAHPKP
jgi:polyhydroxybutyrate depolymerase